MAGVPGQKSAKPTMLPERYELGFMDKLDGRTVVVRELKARLGSLTSDLGGETSLSYGQLALCRRAIFLEARCEMMEAATAEGEDVALHEYLAAVNTLSSILNRLGLRRRSRDVTIDPLDYARRKDRP